MTKPALNHLTGGQLHTYAAVETLARPATAADISAAANFSLVYTTRLLGELTAEGLLTAVKDPTDPRRIRKLWSVAA